MSCRYKFEGSKYLRFRESALDVFIVVVQYVTILTNLITNFIGSKNWWNSKSSRLFSADTQKTVYPRESWDFGCERWLQRSEFILDQVISVIIQPCICNLNVSVILSGVHAVLKTGNWVRYCIFDLATGKAEQENNFPTSNLAFLGQSERNVAIFTAGQVRTF